MSGKEWLRLGLVALTTNAWWAFATWPKIMIHGKPESNPFVLVLAICGSASLLVMAVIGIWETWDQ